MLPASRRPDAQAVEAVDAEPTATTGVRAGTGESAPDPSWALHHLVVAAAAVDTVLADRLGLTPTDYAAVKHLATSPEPLGPNHLPRLLGMSTGSANALVNRLQQRGHLSRHPHPRTDGAWS